MAPDQHDKHLEEAVQVYVDVIFQDLSVTEQRHEEIQRAQENDTLCQEVAQYYQEGWPEKGRIKSLVKRYYPVSSETSMVCGLLMKKEQLVISSVVQKEVL